MEKRTMDKPSSAQARSSESVPNIHRMEVESKSPRSILKNKGGEKGERVEKDSSRPQGSVHFDFIATAIWKDNSPHESTRQETDIIQEDERGPSPLSVDVKGKDDNISSIAELSDEDIRGAFYASGNEDLIDALEERSKEEQPGEFYQWRVFAKAFDYGKNELGKFMALPREEQAQVLHVWQEITEATDVPDMEFWKNLDYRLKARESRSGGQDSFQEKEKKSKIEELKKKMCNVELEWRDLRDSIRDSIKVQDLGRQSSLDEDLRDNIEVQDLEGQSFLDESQSSLNQDFLQRVCEKYDNKHQVRTKTLTEEPLRRELSNEDIEILVEASGNHELVNELRKLPSLKDKESRLQEWRSKAKAFAFDKGLQEELSNEDIATLMEESGNHELVNEFKELSSLEDKESRLQEWRVRAKAFAFDEDELRDFMAFPANMQSYMLSAWNEITYAVGITNMKEWEYIRTTLMEKEDLKESIKYDMIKLSLEIEKKDGKEKEYIQRQYERKRIEMSGEMVHIRNMEKRMSSIERDWGFIREAVNIREFCFKSPEERDRELHSIVDVFKSYYVNRDYDSKKRKEIGKKHRDVRRFNLADNERSLSGRREKLIGRNRIILLFQGVRSEELFIELMSSLNEKTVRSIGSTQFKLKKWLEMKNSRYNDMGEDEVKNCKLQSRVREYVFTQYCSMRSNREEFFKGYPPHGILLREREIEVNYMVLRGQLANDEDLREYIGKHTLNSPDEEISIEQMLSLDRVTVDNLRSTGFKLSKWIEMNRSQYDTMEEDEIQKREEELENSVFTFNQYYSMQRNGEEFFKGDSHRQASSRRQSLEIRYTLLRNKLADSAELKKYIEKYPSRSPDEEIFIERMASLDQQEQHIQPQVVESLRHTGIKLVKWVEMNRARYSTMEENERQNYEEELEDKTSIFNQYYSMQRNREGFFSEYKPDQISPVESNVTEAYIDLESQLASNEELREYMGEESSHLSSTVFGDLAMQKLRTLTTK